MILKMQQVIKLLENLVGFIMAIANMIRFNANDINVKTYMETVKNALYQRQTLCPQS